VRGTVEAGQTEPVDAYLGRGARTNGIVLPVV